jgi:16S rRNA (guanine527-N7)-methyltransferase
VPCIERDESHLADVGSGAGLPGIPLAIALPDRMVTLIEPMRRRAAFLELAVNDLELRNVRVVIERAEHASIGADVCVMRAVVSPESAWAMATHVLRPGGRALVFAGRAFDPGRAPLGTGVLVEECSKARHGLSGPVIIMREGAGPSGSPSEG